MVPASTKRTWAHAAMSFRVGNSLRCSLLQPAFMQHAAPTCGLRSMPSGMQFVVGSPLQHKPCSSLPRGVVGVSSYGRVQNMSGNIHWGSRRRSGYHVTGIGGRNSMVHRLVARAFLGPPPTDEHCDVNHKDRIRSNNHIENLEYVTRGQNIRHSYESNPGRRTSAAGLSKPVVARVLGAGDWTAYPSVQAAARQLSMSTSQISACCQGWRRSTRNWEFQYAPSREPSLLPGEEWRLALHAETGMPLSTWFVSSLGRVKSTRNLVHRGSQTLSGYRSVGISLDGRIRAFFVHRLVARAFLGPPPDTSSVLVHHRDGDRSNNNVHNLEYVTPAQNMRLSPEFMSTRLNSAASRSIPVLGRRFESDSWTFYNSCSEAMRQTGIRAEKISYCSRGLMRHAGMYEFKLAKSLVPRVLPGEEWREIIKGE